MRSRSTPTSAGPSPPARASRKPTRLWPSRSSRTTTACSPDRRVDRDGYVISQSAPDSESARPASVGTAHEPRCHRRYCGAPDPRPVHAGNRDKRVGNEFAPRPARRWSGAHMRPSNADLADYATNRRAGAWWCADLGPADGHHAGALWAHHLNRLALDHGLVGLWKPQQRGRVELPPWLPRWENAATSVTTSQPGTGTASE